MATDSNVTNFDITGVMTVCHPDNDLKPEKRQLVLPQEIINVTELSELKLALDMFLGLRERCNGTVNVPVRIL